MTLLPLPEGLDKFRLPDKALSTAYEMVPDHKRASLKNYIAMLHALLGSAPLDSSQVRKSSAGYVFHLHSFPASFSLVLCQSDYPCAEHLLAAAMPAVFAGVPRVAVAFMPGTSHAVETLCVQEELLLATEIGGLEDVFELPDVEKAFEMFGLLASFGPGRLLTIGRIPLVENLLGKAIMQNHACFCAPSCPEKINSTLEEVDQPHDSVGKTTQSVSWTVFGKLDLCWFMENKITAGFW